MPAYRFYVLAPDGRIQSASDHECADDQAALVHARNIIALKPIESWQATRKVFLLDPDGKVRQ